MVLRHDLMCVNCGLGVTIMKSTPGDGSVYPRLESLSEGDLSVSSSVVSLAGKGKASSVGGSTSPTLLCLYN